ncbi:MAG: LamG-like jellyroll fold domain-containing protein [Saprospiraceae bacterium]
MPNRVLSFLFCIFFGMAAAAFAQGSKNALQFDGNNDYVRANGLCNTLTGGAITFDAWIFPTDNSDDQAIIAFNEDNGSYTNNVNLLYYFGSTGKIVYFDRGPDNYNIPASGYFPTGHWYHVACVISSSLQGKIYVNGVEVLSFNAHETPKAGHLFSIGQEWDGYSTSGFYKGKIDEVRIWKKALTQNEIRERMCRSVPVADPGLTGYFKLDESSGNKAFDQVSQTQLGTLYGFGSSPWVTSGAPIGDESVYLYPASWSGQNLSYSFSPDVEVDVSLVGNNPQGIHIYAVGASPNSTAGLPNIPSGYFGVFATNLTAVYVLTLDYSSSGNCGACDLIPEVYARNDNSVATWSPLLPFIDISACYVLLVNNDIYRSEYVFDFLPFFLEYEAFESDTLSLCQDNLTLRPDTLINGMELLWNTGETSETIAVDGSGQYWLTAQFGDCIFQDTIEVILAEPPLFEYATEEPLCFGEASGALLLNPVDPDLQFSFDGVNFSAATIFGGFAAGEYLLWVRDGQGCVSQVAFEVGQPDPIVIQLPPNLTVNPGLSIQMNAIVTQGAPPYTYLWMPAIGLSCADCPDPFVEAATGQPVYTLLVTDSIGCTAQASVHVQILWEEIKVFIPNVFSPNADNANDLFTVFGGPGVSRVKSMKIFDNWGEKVFEKFDFPVNDLSHGWDGTFRGKKLKPGVFAYRIFVELATGEILHFMGDLTLVR